MVHSTSDERQREAAAATDEGADSGPEAAPRARPSRGGSFLRSFWDWTKSVLVAFALFILVRAFVVEAFKIPTSSMEGTLLVGDFLLVNKAVYGAEIPGTHMHLPAFAEPERGDVIVFNPPHDPDKNYVKRLVGLPGDTLEMRDKVLLVNGDEVQEPYAQYVDARGDAIHPGMGWQQDYVLENLIVRRYRPSRDNWGPLVVPESRFFVLGDNRDNSEDSRYWGFVTRQSIKGRPWFVYYSFDPTARDKMPWLSDVRWSRIGGMIR